MPENEINIDGVRWRAADAVSGLYGGGGGYVSSDLVRSAQPARIKSSRAPRHSAYSAPRVRVVCPVLSSESPSKVNSQDTRPETHAEIRPGKWWKNRLPCAIARLCLRGCGYSRRLAAPALPPERVAVEA